MFRGDWLARARASASSIGASMASRSKAGWPRSARSEVFRNVSAAGFTSRMRAWLSSSSVGRGRLAQITPGTG